jgi:hypothetical protein
MANPDQGPGHDGRPRRQPHTIDGEAVELALGAPPAGAAQSGTSSRDASDTAQAAMWSFVPPWMPRWPFVAAAALGLVAAVAALGIFLTAREEDGAGELPARLAGLEAPQRDDAAEPASSASARIDDLSARLARLESTMAGRPAQTAPDTASATRLAALEAAVKSMVERVDGLDRRSRDTATASRNAGERVDSVAGLLDEIKQAGTRRNALQESERSTLDGFAGRLQTLEATLKSTQEQIEKSIGTLAADKPLRAAMIAAALRGAVERDDPFAAELAVARELGLDSTALAALEPFAVTGVPNRNGLFRELSALVPELFRISTPVGHDDNYLDRLKSHAARWMNIRPIGDAPGDDPAAVIGRIEFRIERQDMAGVLAELEKLPAPARELAQLWRRRATAREAAIASARQVAASSFAKLGEPPAQDVLAR